MKRPVALPARRHPPAQEGDTVAMFGANRKKFTEAGAEGEYDEPGGLYYGQPSVFPQRADKDGSGAVDDLAGGRQRDAFVFQTTAALSSASGQLSQLGASLYGPQSALGFPARGLNSGAPPSRSGLAQSAAAHTPPSPGRGIPPKSGRAVLNHNQQVGGERGGGGRSPGGPSPSIIGMPKQSRQAFTISSMSGFGVSRTPGFNVFNGTDGSENVTGLDPSDFPALADRSRRDGGANPAPLLNPLAGRAPYVGMVTKPSGEQSQDFSIHNEDFPALPGPNYQTKEPGGGGGDDGKTNLSSSGKPASNTDAPKFPGDKSCVSASSDNQHRKGIQVLPDGRVSNIPLGMVTDQFGMIGLLTFIRAAETEPGTVHLALGSDLTTLGLNLNSPENLYPKFASPWASAPCRPQDIDFHVPSEYLTNVHIRDKLAAIKLSRYGEDLLFYLYYMNGGDLLQLLAAVELFNRDWRYHKEERVWITRAPGLEPSLKTNAYERGTYYVFDCLNWRKVAKEFHLEYDKLEERPHVPSTFNYNPAQQAF
ncbi:CCR4-NOT transcription complex subunit 2 isoform X2 [Syngnathus scovelli]|uniref:CCR4-NOT transcription complex subunit 2 isoform X2 n=1 Tax=Syngnathus scovelli TaxID=161590 RepID=UPI00210F63A5|nr:CCR4-NOT transcription complex subunit 2 isoform X2 [Syngnathus scovelli]